MGFLSPVQVFGRDGAGGKVIGECFEAYGVVFWKDHIFLLVAFKLLNACVAKDSQLAKGKPDRKSVV